MSVNEWIPYTTPPVQVSVEDEGDGGASFVVAPADHTLGNVLAAAAEAHEGTTFAASRCERLGTPRVVLRINCDGDPKAIFRDVVRDTVGVFGQLRSMWDEASAAVV